MPRCHTRVIPHSRNPEGTGSPRDQPPHRAYLATFSAKFTQRKFDSRRKFDSSEILNSQKLESKEIGIDENRKFSSIIGDRIRNARHDVTLTKPIDRKAVLPTHRAGRSASYQMVMHESDNPGGRSRQEVGGLHVAVADICVS